jgi:hypothetical protein
MILPILTSQEARIIGMNHWHPAGLNLRLALQHESRRGTIWEERGLVWGGRKRRQCGVNMIKIHCIHV